MQKKLTTPLIAISIGFIMFNILLSPEICIKGAESGLLLWFNKLLPSLLPFIILTNMLFNLGIIFKLSKAFDPFTSKFFKISGSSFIVFIVGFIAGYPTGAKLSKQLLDSHSISYTEAQKTFCFANNCGCLFIIGTVGSILLGDPRIGYFLVLVHILSAFTMLLLFRFYTPKYSMVSKQTTITTPPVIHNFSTAFTSAVQNGMDTIVYVGGYIIFFSVILSILKTSQLVESIISVLATLSGISSTFLTSLFLGSFEFSNGVALVCQSSTLSLSHLGLISFIVGFGGFCVLFQSAHFLQGSNLSLGLYIISKFSQAIIAFIYTLLFYPLFFMYTDQTTIQSSKYIISLFLVIIAIIFIFNRLSSSRRKRSSSHI